jgi:hypothetical protein
VILFKKQRLYIVYVFANEVVCLQSHSNAHPSTQNAIKQITEEATDSSASLALLASPVQHK